jgi:hypothetical protein
MILTPREYDSLLVAATPLMRWLQDRVNPHLQVQVTAYAAEVLEGIAKIQHLKGSRMP